MKTSLVLDTTSFRLPESQYFPTPQIKSSVVLHFTAGGNPQGAFEAWKADLVQTGTAYLIDPLGTIYEVFPPQCWAYHLGIRGLDPSHREDKRSIGIEMVNWGPLRYKDGTLRSWPKFWSNHYCSIGDRNKYLESLYRGERYFAAFPLNQVIAAGKLTRYLCDRFHIEKRFLHAGLRDAYCPERAMQHHGILGHQNYRSDKLDPGPAFDWEIYQQALEQD